MTITTSILLFGAMLVLALIPGPGVLIVVARSMTGGLVSGMTTIAGILLADYLFILLVVFGLSTAAKLMGEFFVLIKYLGAVYLIWLGLSLITKKTEKTNIKPIKSSSHFSNFIIGLLTTLGNPKAILFYLSFFPTFIDLSTVSIIDTGLILAIATLSIGGVLLSYAYLANTSRKIFQSSRAKKLLNYSSGGIMIGTGAVLAIRS